MTGTTVIKGVGVLIALLAVWRIWWVWRDRRRKAGEDPTWGWVQVTGVVTRDHGIRDREHATAEVEFTTREGRVVSGVVESRLYLGGDVTGDRVPVWYDPADPETFSTDVRAGDGSVALRLVAPGFFLLLGLYIAANLSFVPST